MDLHRLTISQMAKMNNISPQTLRYYDNEGLLTPASVDQETGYRYYNITQSARLDMIHHMKSMGLNLRDIKRHIDGYDMSGIACVLDERQSDIERQIIELRQQQRAIRSMVESIRRYRSAPPDGTIVLEYIGPRTIYCYDTGKNFYHEGINIYEQMLRQLKQSMARHNLPQIYYCNAGTVMRQEQLLKQEFYSSEVFLLVDKDYDSPGLLTQLDPATYYCIYCYRFDDEKEYAERLLNFIRQSGLQITGDYLCEVLFEPPVSSNAQREMVMRLQVPISFC